MFLKSIRQLLVALLLVILGMAANVNVAIAQSWYGGGGYHLMQKSCSHCGRAVSLSSQVGDTCPHCGAYWGSERHNVVNRPSFPGATSSNPAVRKPAAKQKVDAGTAAKAPATARPTQRPLLSADGKWSMKSIAEDRVEIANAAGVVLFTAEHRGPVTVEMFDRFGRLLTVDQKGSVSIRILPSALPTIIQRGALSAQFTPDGRVLVVVPRAVAFRDADTGCLLPGRIPAHGRNNTIEEVVVSADSTLAAVHESDGRASVYDTRSGRLIGALGYSAITRDGLTAISKSIAKRSLALQSASRD